MAKRQSYHHGDLRNALLTAALALVEENGLEALSLRKVAARVGVSHAAPEHHFPTLRHLLNAMAITGFDLFTKSMADQRAKAGSGPEEQMRAAATGYLEYARTHPALFRLMFTASLLDWSDETLQASATLGHQQLSEICIPAAEHMGLKTPAEIASLENLVWTQIHGQAHLMIDQKLPDVGNESCYELDRSLDIAGLIFGARASR